MDPSLITAGDNRSGEERGCMHKLLKLESPPTAVFCFNDMMAFGAISAIQSVGLRVPQDISVVGFDDIPLAAVLFPPLTSIAQDNAQMARLAVEMANALATGKPVGERTILSGRLVVRASTSILSS